MHGIIHRWNAAVFYCLATERPTYTNLMLAVASGHEPTVLRCGLHTRMHAGREGGVEEHDIGNGVEVVRSVTEPAERLRSNRRQMCVEEQRCLRLKACSQPPA